MRMPQLRRAEASASCLRRLRPLCRPRSRRRPKPEPITAGEPTGQRGDCGPRPDRLDRCDGRRCRPGHCRDRAARARCCVIPTCNFILHGDEAVLKPLARQARQACTSASRSAMRRSACAWKTSPAMALRRGRNTSMWHAIECGEERRKPSRGLAPATPAR